MTEIDLEQGAAYGYRQSFDGSDVSVYYSDGEDVTSSGESYEYEGGETAPPEKDCRICHFGLETSGGGAIELGCSCKEDLAVAHRQCAETWFKIKGDKICEICQSVARNVGGANVMVMRNGEETAAVEGGGATTAIENMWQAPRMVNKLLVCMVIGVLSPAIPVFFLLRDIY